MVRIINAKAFVCLVSLIISVTSPIFSAANDIVEIKDLVEDAASAEWTGINEEKIAFDGSTDYFGSANSGIKLGGENGDYSLKTDTFSYNKDSVKKTIDIHFGPTFGRRESVVRGSYDIQLPQL